MTDESKRTYRNVDAFEMDDGRVFVKSSRDRIPIEYVPAAAARGLVEAARGPMLAFRCGECGYMTTISREADRHAEREHGRLGTQEHVSVVPEGGEASPRTSPDNSGESEVEA